MPVVFLDGFDIAFATFFINVQQVFSIKSITTHGTLKIKSRLVQYSQAGRRGKL